MKKSSLIMLLLGLAHLAMAQSDDDALFIKDIHDHTLTSGQCYFWLDTLTSEMPGRLAGTESYDSAAVYMEEVLRDIGVDTTYVVPCEVDLWSRGQGSQVMMIRDGLSTSLSSLTLGGSIATGPDGVVGEVVVVESLDEVRAMDDDALAGKIVLYNRPMDPTQVRTFNAYGGAVDQRVYGASVAAAKGAVAVLVRSMTLSMDDVPHTGTMLYEEEVPKIPAVAVSTLAAEQLAMESTENAAVTVRVVSGGNMVGKRPSNTVVGEIAGTTYPDEIILVGGHLDSWDVGSGAHDDGSGCVHSLQVLATLLDLGYKPQRTLRCVLFSNEENGLKGAIAYADQSNAKEEKHLFALESDAGGFSPRGFSFDGDKVSFESNYRAVSQWLPLLEPYGLQMTTGGSGADISRLKSQGGLLCGLRPDSQRYFDYHHTDRDNIDAVNKRELELGAAAMTSLIYLVDKYGLR